MQRRKIVIKNNNLVFFPSGFRLKKYPNYVLVEKMMKELVVQDVKYQQNLKVHLWDHSSINWMFVIENIKVYVCKIRYDFSAPTEFLSQFISLFKKTTPKTSILEVFKKYRIQSILFFIIFLFFTFYFLRVV